eukprot:TRINITY_DN2914_c0_g1_i1.p1 TRINITY_DN2914_c0_g1~~TRINITY_DN2914_c0_g1_i1.p1  ORF type:complete len:389 (+),score=58.84 TRINITY_DN2914_c0_g1_i1:27-1169(+)
MLVKLAVALLAGSALAIDDGIDEGYFKPAHLGQAGVATGYWLTEAAQKDRAVCLDGTPGVYYHRPGTGQGAKKWYIHQQGGGWCESYSSCYSRALGDLGSSKNYPKAATFEGGYFDTDPKNNPMMYDWNLGYLKYCDGNSFSGSNITSQPYSNLTLHFRGRHILDAAIEDLLQNRGLKDATDVVVSGCSAGGLATFLHCDYWAEKIQQAGSRAKVVCMPDSGFFLDYEGPPKYHSGMIWAFYAQNSSSGVNQQCISAHSSTKDEWMCMFAEHTAPHIKTPTFPLQSVYDSWQVNNDLDSQDPATINEWGANLTKLIHTNLLNQPQHSVFLDSCLHHCGGWDNIRINGDLQAVGFQKWYEGQVRSPYIQGKPYKCDACCQP